VSTAIAIPRTRAAAQKRPPARRAPPKAPPQGIRLPVAPATARRALLWALAALLLALLIGALLAMRVPQRISDWALTQSVRAGFEVANVRVTGTRTLAPAAVEAAALDSGTSAILALDLDAARARVRALPWVADASVARRLPDAIEIAVTERTPAALWRLGERTQLIDATGHHLPVRDFAPYARLPLLIGPGADAQLASLNALLSTQPALAARVDAATWVGERRWDLTLKSHQAIMLPEDYARAQAALAQFVRLEKTQPFGGAFVRFDFRLPGQMVLRLTQPPAAAAKSKGTAI